MKKGEGGSLVLSEQIGKTDHSLVFPAWFVKMAVKMADTADNVYTDPDRIELHDDGRITFHFVREG
jgi:hypothetical protein